MCLQEVTHSCGHTIRETVEPIDLSLWAYPIHADRKCWRCLGERHRPHVSYYGDYRIVFTCYLDAPSEGTASEAETTPNVIVPSTSSRTNSPHSSHALELLFVPVFNSRDLPNQSTYSGYTSAQESDTDDGGQSPNPIPYSRFWTTTTTTNNNRSAYVIDGILHHNNSHENPSVPLPDFQSTNIAGPNHSLPSSGEVVDVETLYHDYNNNNNTNRTSTEGVTAGKETVETGESTNSPSEEGVFMVSEENGGCISTEPETETYPPAPPQIHSFPSNFEGSEIEFSGLSIRPEDANNENSNYSNGGIR